jgi:tetratricopeptide (TPR) repeat protein
MGLLEKMETAPKATLWGISLLSILGVVIFANALENPFHYDDLHSIRYNPHIRKLENIPLFFTDTQTFSSQERGTMFRPLLLVSYALNYAVDGQRVWGYRLVNLALHIGCAVWVSLILIRFNLRRLLAWGLGALFLLHPVHGEPVNYISSRSDLLVSFACLALVWLALDTRRRVLGVYGVFIAALLVKSVAIVMPVIIGFYYVSRNGLQGLWRRPLPVLGGIGVAYIGVLYAHRFLASSMAKAPRGLEVQMLTQIKGYVYYLWLFCMPVNLSIEPSFSASHQILSGPVLAAGALLASLLFWALKAYGDLRGFGFLWFVVALMPASLVPLNILVSQRRIYLASAGLFLVLAGVVWQASGHKARQLSVWAGLVGLVFAISVVGQNRVWASPLTLWQDAVAKGPGMFRSQMNLALAYVKQGDHAKALHHLDIALRIKPDYADAWAERGNILNDTGRQDAALEAYSKALQYRPDMAGVYYNLGRIYQRFERLAEAEQQYGLALEYNPRFAKTHNNLGQLYESQGKMDKAFKSYQQALKIDPDMPQAWFNLAALAEAQGKQILALEGYTKAYQLLVDDPEFARNETYRQFAQRALDGQGRLKK